MREEYLLTGPLEATNRPYALAKIAGIEMCWAYNRQYGSQFLAVMPTNLYGPGDNYDLETSHVIPALIRKFHEAKMSGAKEVVVWGTGTPRREFLYCDDLADGCLFLMNLPEDQFFSLVAPHAEAPLINIGCGEDLTIRELSEFVKDVVGFQGEIGWDTDKPDGTPRKLLEVSRMHRLGWQSRTQLMEGLGKAYADLVAKHSDH